MMEKQVCYRGVVVFAFALAATCIVRAKPEEAVRPAPAEPSLQPFQDEPVEPPTAVETAQDLVGIFAGEEAGRAVEGVIRDTAVAIKTSEEAKAAAARVAAELASRSGEAKEAARSVAAQVAHELVSGTTDKACQAVGDLKNRSVRAVSGAASAVSGRIRRFGR